MQSIDVVRYAEQNSATFWRDPAFVDFFCREEFTLSPGLLGTSCSSVTGYPSSLRFVSRTVQQLLTDAEAGLTPEVRAIIARAHGELGDKGPAGDTGAWTRLMALTRWSSQSSSQSSQHTQASAASGAAQLTGLVCETVSRIRGLYPGGVAVIPMGLSSDSDKPPIFILMIVHRPPAASAMFQVAVVNTSGFGCEYHAYRVEEGPDAGVISRDALLVLRNVIPERIVHSSFWVAAYRLLLRPAPTNVHTFYSVLLPHLNCKPLFSNWVSQKIWNSKGSDKDNQFKLGGFWFPSPSLRQPGSCVPGALACVHFLLQTVEGLSYSDVRFVTSLFIVWAAILSCRSDLQLLINRAKSRSLEHQPWGNDFVEQKASCASPLISPFHISVLRCALR